MNPVVLQIILIVMPIVLTPLIGLVIVQVKAFIAKLPANQRAFLLTIISDVVLGVEQAEKASGMGGVDKKALALKLISEELAHWGISVPESIISTLVETVVNVVNQAEKTAAVPVTAQAALGPAKEAK